MSHLKRCHLTPADTGVSEEQNNQSVGPCGGSIDIRDAGAGAVRIARRIGQPLYLIVVEVNVLGSGGSGEVDPVCRVPGEPSVVHREG